ncbi:MAG: ABC transporter ATP-binding protein/permease [Anaerolineae bacterium]|nr:ABC transporter ATP-binding protein/permease [Anaerolineae bacterium]
MIRKFSRFRESHTTKFVFAQLKGHWALLSLQVMAGLGAAVFEGLTLAIFALALQTLSSESIAETLAQLGRLGEFIEVLGLNLNRNSLFILLVCLAVVSQLLRSALEFAADVASAYLQSTVEGETRRQIFQQFMKLSYGYISGYKAGDLASYMEQTNYLGHAIERCSTLLNQSLLVVTYVVVLLWLSVPMTLVALGALFLISLSLGQVIKRVRAVAKKFKKAAVAITELTVEFLNGIAILHVFARQDYATQRLEQVIKKSMTARRKGLIWQASISPLVDSFTVLGVAVLLVGGYLLAGETNDFFVARLGTFLFVIYRLTPRISVINKNWGLINSYLPFIERIASLLREDDKEFINSGNTVFSGLADGVEFHCVSLNYHLNTTGMNQPALSNVSFKLAKGEMVALVGESGAGKSSVIYLLLRLFDATEGEIRVDGTKLQELNLESWRSHIGVVSQDDFIFNTSIRENIAFGKLDATDEEIIRAAKIAHAHEFIMQLPDRYETAVGDRGRKLSGGQRQRIAIARAVIREPNILVLDEATSDLDSQSEREIQLAIEELRNRYTIISIAHRLSTIAIADKILVLAGGRLVETGSHKELMVANQRYAHLWKLQSQGHMAVPIGQN